MLPVLLFVALGRVDIEHPLPGVVFNSSPPTTWSPAADVIQAHTRATASTAAEFLDTLLHRIPIRAVQVDGGSEFAAQFEQACQHRVLRLFGLPPRSPKLHGAVANRTHFRREIDAETDPD